jgi:hypothetical protein
LRMRAETSALRLGLLDLPGPANGGAHLIGAASSQSSVADGGDTKKP